MKIIADDAKSTNRPRRIARIVCNKAKRVGFFKKLTFKHLLEFYFCFIQVLLSCCPIPFGEEHYREGRGRLDL